MCLGGGTTYVQAPATPAPVMPDYSAQLDALTMQNQALQDQLNEMNQAQVANIVQDPPAVAGDIIGSQQTMADTASLGDAEDARQGRRGRKSLRIRRKTTARSGAGGGVRVPGGSPASTSGRQTSGKSRGPRIPKY